MARSFSKLWFSLFQDEHFCSQPILDKLLFTVLLGQQAFNYAGLSPIQLRKWAKGMRPATDMEIKAALIRLERNRYVFTDSDSEEVLIRSFIRNDEVEKQPNLLISALSSAAELESPKLAAVLLSELARVTVPETSSEKLAKRMDAAWRKAHARLAERAGQVVEPFPEPFAEDFPEGLPKDLAEGFQRPAETEPFPEGLTEGSPEGLPKPLVVVAVSSLTSPTEIKGSTDQKISSTKPPRTEPKRDDVEALCTRLREGVVANGSKPPNITDAWRREARLLLDKDQRRFQEALGLIDWSQNHDFWRRNVMSMDKFRQQYDRLRMQAETESGSRASPSPSGQSRGDQKVQNILNIGSRLVGGNQDTKEIRK